MILAVMAQFEDVAATVLDQYGFFALFVLFAGYLVFMDIRSRRMESVQRERLESDRQHIENKTSAMVTERFGFLLDRETVLQTRLIENQVALAELRGKYNADKENWDKQLTAARREAEHFKDLSEANEESLREMHLKSEGMEQRLRRLEDAFEAQRKELIDERKRREKLEAEKIRLVREKEALLASVQTRIDEATKTLLDKIAELEAELLRRDAKIAELEKVIRGGGDDASD